MQREEEEEERNIPDLEPTGFEGRGGALVEEAKRLMQNDDDEAAPTGDNGGPKIKMSKIGRKPKKGEPTTAATTKSKDKAGPAADTSKPSEKSLSGTSGFTE